MALMKPDMPPVVDISGCSVCRHPWEVHIIDNLTTCYDCPGYMCYWSEL